MSHVEKSEISVPYPTMAELSLGANPDIDATAPAVIIGPIPDSIIDTSAALSLHEKVERSQTRPRAPKSA